MTHNWWTRAGGQVGAGSGSRRGNRRGLRPELLVLEDRQLLATLMVTNTSASGAGSLAQAVATANGNSQANTIQFGPLFNTRQTITLGAQLELSDTNGAQTITGPANGVTVNGGGNSRVFQVDRSVTASFSGLNITGGFADQGGGVLTLPGSNVTLNNCTISGNSVTQSNLPGNGGGIRNYGTATLNNCIVSGNTAEANGGGMFNSSGTTATLSNCSFNSNTASGGIGGGISNSGAVILTMTNCNFSSNISSGDGGAIGSTTGATSRSRAAPSAAIRPAARGAACPSSRAR